MVLQNSVYSNRLAGQIQLSGYSLLTPALQKLYMVNFRNGHRMCASENSLRRKLYRHSSESHSHGEKAFTSLQWLINDINGL